MSRLTERFHLYLRLIRFDRPIGTLLLLWPTWWGLWLAASGLCGRLYGGVVGALILLCLEEVLAGFTLHWHIGLGLLLLGIVMFAPKGVAALFGKSHG